MNTQKSIAIVVIGIMLAIWLNGSTIYIKNGDIIMLPGKGGSLLYKSGGGTTTTTSTTTTTTTTIPSFSSYVDVTTNMTANDAPSPSIVSASSEYSGSYPAWRAFDGNEAADWEPAVPQSNPSWLQYDFSASTSPVINKFTIKGYPSYSPKDIELIGSVDADTWTSLQVTNVRDNTGVTFSYTNYNLTAYRYYRLNVTNTYDIYMGVLEFRLFEGRN